MCLHIVLCSRASCNLLPQFLSVLPPCLCPSFSSHLNPNLKLWMWRLLAHFLWTWASGKVSHWYCWNKYEAIPKITKSVRVFSGRLSTLKLVLVTRNTKRRKKGKSSYLTCNNYSHITKCQVDLFCFFRSLPWSFMLCSSNFWKEALLSTLQIRKEILWWKNREDWVSRRWIYKMRSSQEKTCQKLTHTVCQAHNSIAENLPPGHNAWASVSH